MLYLLLLLLFVKTAVFLHNYDSVIHDCVSAIKLSLNLNQEVVPVMNSDFLYLLDLLVQFGLILITLLGLAAIRWLIIRIKKRLIKPPIQQFLNWFLLVLAGAILFSAVMAAGGQWMANLINNTGYTMPLIGGVVGWIAGVAVGWEIQRRTIL